MTTETDKAHRERERDAQIERLLDADMRDRSLLIYGERWTVAVERARAGRVAAIRRCA